MDGLQAHSHGGREVRSYTANRRELRFGVVAAQAASGCSLALVPDICVRSTEALIRTAQGSRQSYSQRCRVNPREVATFSIFYVCTFIQCFELNL